MAKRPAKAAPKAAQSRKRSSTTGTKKVQPKKAAPRSRAVKKVARPAKKSSPARARTKPAAGKKKPAAPKKTAKAARSPIRRRVAPRPAAKTRKAAAPKRAAKKAAPATKKAAATAAKPRARSSMESRRRELEEMVPSPPSSLNMNRRGSAARTGRDEMAEERADHATMTPSITGGDVDANVEDAYFTGDEAPGGDNSTPDQDIVDDIGKALGVEYQDNEELRGSDKVADRDKHRWELDPASSEDYRDRRREDD